MRRLRPLKIAALLLLALVVAAALLLRHHARPERVAALLGEQARSRLGLELAFRQPARYSLWPQLRLQLADARLSLPGDPAPLLALPNLVVSLPWSSLRDSRLSIQELRLEQPQLDLDAVQRWLQQTPGDGSAPDLQLHLVVERATLLRGGKPLAQGLEFAGDVATQDLDRWWNELLQAAPNASALPPFPGKATIDTLEIDGVTLKGIRLETGPAQ